MQSQHIFGASLIEIGFPYSDPIADGPVIQRATDEGLCAMGLRFTRDPAVPGERFDTLRQRLGDAFEVIEIDSSPGNEHGFGRMAHSVLTDQVREKDGHPAYEARNRVVEFFNERLRG